MASKKKATTDEVKLTDPQKKVLAFMKKNGGTMGVGEIASNCGLPNVSAWSSVRSLITKGLVKELKDGYKAA